MFGLGGAGDDMLIGGSGNDALGSGADDDDLTGGPGEDTCDLAPGRDTARNCEVVPTSTSPPSVEHHLAEFNITPVVLRWSGLMFVNRGHLPRSRTGPWDAVLMGTSDPSHETFLALMSSPPSEQTMSGAPSGQRSWNTFHSSGTCHASHSPVPSPMLCAFTLPDSCEMSSW